MTFCLTGFPQSIETRYNINMAKDAIHDSIKNALIKDGWTVTAEFLQIEYEELEIFADLVAEREPIVAEKNGAKIIVEVKTFAGRSFIRELQQALGQYELYLDIMGLAGFDYDLYLAVSSLIYDAFFLRKGTHEIVQRHQLKLIVVDVARGDCPMDPVKAYPMLIKQALREYVALVEKSHQLPYQVVMAFDDEHQQYLVRKLGWTENKRILKTVLHVALQNGKIWIEEDWTEEGIATWLLEHGVPHCNIVLGFQPPLIRSYSEFSVA